MSQEEEAKKPRILYKGACGRNGMTPLSIADDGGAGWGSDLSVRF